MTKTISKVCFESGIGVLASHLLDQNNKLHVFERSLIQFEKAIQTFAEIVNKQTFELSNKLQVLESRIQEVERLQVSTEVKGNTPFSEEGGGNQVQH